MEILWNIWICAKWERGRIHEHKTPFRKQLRVQAFSILLCQWETHSESAHGHCLVGFVFKCATHGIRCSSPGGYQTALHYCRHPLLDWGWIGCIRCKASCTKPRCPYRDGSVWIHVSLHPYYSILEVSMSHKYDRNCIILFLLDIFLLYVASSHLLNLKSLFICII